jgi:hypothetical protein
LGLDQRLLTPSQDGTAQIPLVARRPKSERGK